MRKANGENINKEANYTNMTTTLKTEVSMINPIENLRSSNIGVVNELRRNKAKQIVLTILQ